ncbi:hypothetical protein K474DRAFT_1765103 [Panus rudis PR-1116 ss-1]|nr:hypothetical protein K474DRAFT_1765103 [Panus rudis PR-1116 ss-1]
MTYCERCNRFFGSDSALEQHEQDSPNHHICDDCDRDFVTRQALVSHWTNNPVHSYCGVCDEHFDDHEELDEHYEDEHWFCSSCKKLFDSEQSLNQHNQKHKPYCKSCKRFFDSENNLQTHLRSNIHKPNKYKCPGARCQKAFISDSALIMHCESGACRSGVTRHAVNFVILAIDQGRTITNPNKLIGYHDLSGTVTACWATNASWNGGAFECYLCHKEFRKLAALNMHLGSPAHQEKIYRCPKTWGGCNVEFTTLSGLFQHVESGSCGVKRFRRQVGSVMSSLTDRMKYLTF